jgi:hypothetical protein
MHDVDSEIHSENACSVMEFCESEYLQLRRLLMCVGESWEDLPALMTFVSPCMCFQSADLTSLHEVVSSISVHGRIMTACFLGCCMFAVMFALNVVVL